MSLFMKPDSKNVPSVFFNGPHGVQDTQFWKVSDAKAQKNGNNQTVYWCKEQKRTKSLVKEPRAKKQWKVGATYKGEWKDNLKHGFGIEISSNGHKYEGDWARGFREGHGVFWINLGKGELRKQYAGNWLAGKKSGAGVFYSKNGDRYEGNWQNDLKHGRGTLFFSDGDCAPKNEFASYRTKHKSSAGSVYVGDWHEGKKCGFGTLTKSNKDVYEGEWLNDKREGAGIYYYKSKEKVYDGEWVNDLPKCGVYTSSTEFFQDGLTDTEEEQKEGEPPSLRARRRVPIPFLRLAEPDELLAERMNSIQLERQAARNLPYIQLEQLFSEEGIDDLRRIFASADEADSGKISPSQLPALFAELGFIVDEKELAALLVDIDKSNVTSLSFSDFVRAAHIVDEAKSLLLEQSQQKGTGD